MVLLNDGLVKIVGRIRRKMKLLAMKISIKTAIIKYSFFISMVLVLASRGSSIHGYTYVNAAYIT
jgi:hypothetical protein